MGENLLALLKIFAITRKRDLKRHCRSLVILKEDFADLILTCHNLRIPFHHSPVFGEHIPDHLSTTKEEFEAFVAASGKELQGLALKFVNKTAQALSDRKLTAGHLFTADDKRFWFFFSFDQRDYDTSGNHWKYLAGIPVSLIEAIPRV